MRTPASGAGRSAGVGREGSAVTAGFPEGGTVPADRHGGTVSSYDCASDGGTPMMPPSTARRPPTRARPAPAERSLDAADDRVHRDEPDPGPAALHVQGQLLPDAQPVHHHHSGH